MKEKLNANQNKGQNKDFAAMGVAAVITNVNAAYVTESLCL